MSDIPVEMAVDSTTQLMSPQSSSMRLNYPPIIYPSVVSERPENETGIQIESTRSTDVVMHGDEDQDEGGRTDKDQKDGGRIDEAVTDVDEVSSEVSEGEALMV